jgi:hypothetical protein
MPTKNGAVTPAEAEAARLPLSPLAQKVVDFINPQLTKHRRGSGAASGPGSAQAIHEAAEEYRSAGWRVATGYEEGIPKITEPGYIRRPATTITVSK